MFRIREMGSGTRAFLVSVLVLGIGVTAALVFAGSPGATPGVSMTVSAPGPCAGCTPSACPGCADRGKAAEKAATGACACGDTCSCCTACPGKGGSGACACGPSCTCCPACPRASASKPAGTTGCPSGKGCCPGK